MEAWLLRQVDLGLMLQTPIIVMLVFLAVGVFAARAWYAEKVVVLESRLAGVKESSDSEMRQLKAQAQGDLAQAKELAEQQRENYQEHIKLMSLKMEALEISRGGVPGYTQVIVDGIVAYRSKDA